MAAGWSVEATRALIALWGEHNVQEKLDGVSKNKTIYEKIAASMREQGYDWFQTKSHEDQKPYCKIS